MKKILLIPSLALLPISALQAGSSEVAPAPEIVPASDDGWEFTLGLYGWGAGLDGDIGAAGVVAPVDISFSDILDTLDMTVMGAGELRRGNWMFQLEGLYLRNSIKGVRTRALPRNRNVALSAKLTAETTRVEAVAGYRVLDNGSTTIDLLGGAVLYDISNELTFIGPRAVRGATSGDSWVDPVVGFRINQRLGDRWMAHFRGEVGGFGVNADFLWQAYAMLGYQLTDSSVLFAGWRHAAVDYQNGGFLYDVASSGPILGATITF